MPALVCDVSETLESIMELAEWMATCRTHYSMQSILGETLVTRSGSKVSTTPALAGSKYVAVYCSAHWCPPCRQFTPLLGEFFKSQAAALKVAVVFATGDRDEKSFKDYFARYA
jgi:thiol-disulfide isomerase/thioredoxin